MKKTLFLVVVFALCAATAFADSPVATAAGTDIMVVTSATGLRQRQVRETDDGAYYIIPLRRDGRLMDSLAFAKGLPVKVLRRPADYFWALRAPNRELINPADYGRMIEFGYDYVLLPTDAVADNKASRTLLAEARKRTKRSASDVLVALRRVIITPQNNAVATDQSAAPEPDASKMDLPKPDASALLTERSPVNSQPGTEVITNDDIAEAAKDAGKDNAEVEAAGRASQVMEVAPHRCSVNIHGYIPTAVYAEIGAPGALEVLTIRVADRLELVSACGHVLDLRLNYVEKNWLDVEEVLPGRYRLEAVNASAYRKVSSGQTVNTFTMQPVRLRVYSETGYDQGEQPLVVLICILP